MQLFCMNFHILAYLDKANFVHIRVVKLYKQKAYFIHIISRYYLKPNTIAEYFLLKTAVNHNK